MTKRMAARKANPATEIAMESKAAQRAMNTFAKSVGKQVLKEDRKETEQLEAMADTLPRLLESLNEEQLAGLFFMFEARAPVSKRKKIAAHRLRPESVDAMLAEAEAESAETDDASEAPASTHTTPTGETLNGEEPRADSE